MLTSLSRHHYADCPDGALVAVFSDHDIEDKISCPGFAEDQCVDRLYTDVYGGEVSCGKRKPVIDFARLSVNELRVTFQTNGQKQFCGFNINTYCVPFYSYDTEGCVFPPEDSFRRGHRSVRSKNPKLVISKHYANTNNSIWMCLTVTIIFN